MSWSRPASQRWSRCWLATGSKTADDRQGLPPQGGVMTDLVEPGSELSLTVRGYEVIVRTAPDGTMHVTCPELPQVSVRDQTLASALARAEDAIDAIWAGEFVRPLGSA